MQQKKQPHVNYAKDMPMINARLALALINHLAVVNEPPTVHRQMKYMRPNLPCGWCFVFATALFLTAVYYMSR